MKRYQDKQKLKKVIRAKNGRALGLALGYTDLLKKKVLTRKNKSLLSC